MAIDLTVESVMEAAEAVVAERGADFVYPTEWRRNGGYGACQYVIQDLPSGEGALLAPACLVGAILHRLGVPLKEMLMDDGSDVLLYHLEMTGVITCPPLVSSLLSRGQGVQDRRTDPEDADNSWGHALEVMKELRADGEAQDLPPA